MNYFHSQDVHNLMRRHITAGLFLSLLTICGCHGPSPSTTNSSAQKIINDPELIFHPVNDHYCWGDLKGEITNHVADALDSFISRNNCQSISLGLSSPGGDVDAAMRMGRAIRTLDGLTVTEGDCFSACPLVLAGGSRRITDSGIPSQDPKIGVHSFYSIVPSADLTDAKKRYSETYKNVKNYLEEMRISPTLLDICYGTPPWDIRILTAQELKDTHLSGADPIHLAVDATKRAAKQGISLSAFYKRMARMEPVCQPILLNVYQQTSDMGLASIAKSNCMEEVESGTR